MADTKAQGKVAIKCGNTDETPINTGVFFVTRIQVDPVHGNYTRLTIHYAREPEEQRRASNISRRFSCAMISQMRAGALENCVAENIAKDAINRADRLKLPN